MLSAGFNRRKTWGITGLGVGIGAGAQGEIVPPPIQPSRVMAPTHTGNAYEVGLGERQRASGHIVFRRLLRFPRPLHYQPLDLISDEAHAPLLATTAQPVPNGSRHGLFWSSPWPLIYRHEMVYDRDQGLSSVVTKPSPSAVSRVEISLNSGVVTRTLSSTRTCPPAVSHGRHRRPGWTPVSKRAWTGARISGCCAKVQPFLGAVVGSVDTQVLGRGALFSHPCTAMVCIMNFPSMISRGRGPCFPIVRPPSRPGAEVSVLPRRVDGKFGVRGSEALVLGTGQPHRHGPSLVNESIDQWGIGYGVWGSPCAIFSSPC